MKKKTRIMRVSEEFAKIIEKEAKLREKTITEMSDEWAQYEKRKKGKRKYEITF